MVAHDFDVSLDSLPDVPLRFFKLAFYGDAPGQIGDVAVAGSDFSIYHRVFSLFHFKPACFKTLLSVPGGISLDGSRPGALTVPGLVG